MKRARLCCAVVGLVTFLGCVTTPPPPPANPAVSMIGIKVRIDRPLWFDEEATEVLFVRLDEPAASGLIISSNYFKDGYAYLFNAPPGRYGVVAASVVNVTPGSAPRTEITTWKGGHTTTTTTGGFGSASANALTVYPPGSFVEETATTVGAGEVAFLGEAVLDARGDWQKADETQQFYRDLLAPWYREADALTILTRASDRHVPSARYTVDRQDAARERFLDRTRSGMADSGWTELMRSPVTPAALSQD